MSILLGALAIFGIAAMILIAIGNMVEDKTEREYQLEKVQRRLDKKIKERRDAELSNLKEE